MPLAALPTDRSRRALLRGAASAVMVRPPGAVDEAPFVERCTRCNACIVACSEHLLVRAEAGFPERDWQRGECTFCNDCIAASETGSLLALLKQPKIGTTAWTERVCQTV